jgi:hypothetical protein
MVKGHHNIRPCQCMLFILKYRDRHRVVTVKNHYFFALENN